MVSLSDLANGPKLFEETFGRRWGRRYWRVFFAVAVLAILVACLEQIGAFGEKAFVRSNAWYQAAGAWLYPKKATLTPAAPPANAEATRPFAPVTEIPAKKPWWQH
jgi:hypothetical protein